MTHIVKNVSRLIKDEKTGVTYRESIDESLKKIILELPEAQMLGNPRFIKFNDEMYEIHEIDFDDVSGREIDY